MAKANAFQVAQEQLDECARIIGLDDSVLALLRVPMREFHFSVPVRMDDGTLKVFQGFRVQYNDALGPTKGGIRFHPDETIDTIRALAAWMTWKCSLLNLPLGGAKGGVICDPKILSLSELERLSRSYIKSAWPVIGPDRDIPAPDVYTTPQIMGWMMDEYSRIAGKNQFGVVTGKPLEIGGSAGRGEATAQGGWYTIREAASECGFDLQGATVAIQGYGNAGFNAALLGTQAYGCKVVAVSDTQGGVFSKRGFDPQAIADFKAKSRSVVGFPGAKAISNMEIFKLGVDILIPAALENVITKENAPQIRAKIVAELANGPTTPEADNILYQKGIHVIPDFLCNAGGVTVSYFEMVQNFQMYYWTKDEVNDRLDRKMAHAYRAVLDTSRKLKIHMRQAAYAVSVRRVVEAMKLRGWI